jgi:hypothetical protein
MHKTTPQQLKKKNQQYKSKSFTKKKIYINKSKSLKI